MTTTAARHSIASASLPPEVRACLWAGCADPVRMVPVGSTHSTWLSIVGGRRRIVKRFREGWTAEQVTHLFDVLQTAGVPAPPLLKCVDVGPAGYALFDFVPGHVPLPGTAQWEEMCDAVFVLLGQLQCVPLDAAFQDIEARWIERAASTAAADAGGRVRALHDRVTASSGPARSRSDGGAERSAGWRRVAFAHGDLAPQNLLRTGTGFVLVDWEEAGIARLGFDAGWLLALNRIGAGLRMERRRLLGRLAGLGFRRDELDHFEGLGLLRLHHRAAGWSAQSPDYAPLVARIRAAIGAHLDQPALHRHTRRTPTAPSCDTSGSTPAAAGRHA